MNLYPRSTHSARLRKVWCYEKADIEKLNKVLDSSDWSAITSAPDIDSAWSIWLDIFQQVVSTNVPSKVVKKVSPKLPWMSPSIEAEIKKKHALFRAFKRQPSVSSRMDFNKQRNLVTKLLRKAERVCALTAYRNMKNGSSSESTRRFWALAAQVTGKKKQTVIPDLIDAQSSSVVSSSSGKASLLDRFFVSQTHLNIGSATPDTASLPSNPENMTSLHITPSKVFDILRHLPVNKAGGLDGITPRLLRICAPGIAVSLAELINRSFCDCAFPRAWKKALVIPVFKRGDKSNPTNYRPISLLSAVGKVAERVLFNAVYPFISAQLSDCQSGFRKKDSTPLQLFRLVQQWSEAVDKGCYVGVIFFDLQKALDKVWHAGVLGPN